MSTKGIPVGNMNTGGTIVPSLRFPTGHLGVVANDLTCVRKGGAR